jgi:hypothetical protein
MSATLPDGYSILPADGDPNGPRVSLSCGSVTSLANHAGALDHLTEAQLAALHEAAEQLNEETISHE